VEQRLRGIGTGIGADENGGLPGIENELAQSGRVLLTSSVEVLDRAAVVRPAETDVRMSKNP